MPFLAEHLWQALVTRRRRGRAGLRLPRRLARGARARTRRCWPRSPSCARVVALGHQARSAAGLKLRQPLRRIVVEGAPLAAAHADEIAEELRVKEVEFGHVDAELRVKPHLPVLGPKLGKELGAVRAALQAGDVRGARRTAASVPRGTSSGRTRCSSSGPARTAGRSPATPASPSRSTPRVDDELALEGRVYELIHRVNSMRKEAGLELTDRITLTIPAVPTPTCSQHADWIATETLAVSVEVGDGRQRAGRSASA